LSVGEKSSFTHRPSDAGSAIFGTLREVGHESGQLAQGKRIPTGEKVLHLLKKMGKGGASDIDQTNLC
jgi:hypothetical protein